MQYIIRSERQREAARAELDALPIEPPYEVVIRRYKRSKSVEQLRLIHAIFGEVSVKYMDRTGELYSGAVWKEYFKDRLLPEKVMILPNGKTRIVETSLADLSVDRMSRFIDDVINLCHNPNEAIQVEIHLEETQAQAL